MDKVSLYLTESNLNRVVMPEAPPEQELLTRTRHSDLGAYRKLFDRHYAGLFRIVHYRCRDWDLAQDICQETFLRVWTNRHRIDPGKSFFAWLARISSNLLKDAYKKADVRAKYREAIPTPTASQGDNPEQHVHESLLREELDRIVNTDLPPKCRMIFILSRNEGRTNGEIADLLNLSIKTVENQLYKALKIIRKKMEKFL